MTAPNIPWIIRDNAGHEVLSYEINDPVRAASFDENPMQALYGVEVFVYTQEQRDQICRLIERWNKGDLCV